MAGSGQGGRRVRVTGTQSHRARDAEASSNFGRTPHNHPSFLASAVCISCDVNVLSVHRPEGRQGGEASATATGGGANGRGKPSDVGRRYRSRDQISVLTSVGHGRATLGEAFESDSGSLRGIPSIEVQQERERVIMNDVLERHRAVSNAALSTSAAPASVVRAYPPLPPYTASKYSHSASSTPRVHPDASYGRYLRKYLERRGSTVPHQQALTDVATAPRLSADASATQKALVKLATTLTESRCVGFSIVDERFKLRQLMSGLGQRIPSVRFLHANGLASVLALDHSTHDAVRVNVNGLLSGSFVVNACVSGTYLRVMVLDSRKIVVVSSAPAASGKGKRIPLDNITKLSDMVISVSRTSEVPLDVIMNKDGTLIVVSFPSNVVAYAVANDVASITRERARQKARTTIIDSIFREERRSAVAGSADDGMLTEIGREAMSGSARAAFMKFDSELPNVLYFVRGPFVEHAVHARSDVVSYVGGEGGGDARTAGSPSERSLLRMESRRMKGDVVVGDLYGDHEDMYGPEGSVGTGSTISLEDNERSFGIGGALGGSYFNVGTPMAAGAMHLRKGVEVVGNSVWLCEAGAAMGDDGQGDVSGNSSSIGRQRATLIKQMSGRDGRGGEEHGTGSGGGGTGGARHGRGTGDSFRLVYDAGVMSIGSDSGFSILFGGSKPTQGDLRSTPPASLVSLSTSSLISAFDVSRSGDYIALGCIDGAIGIVYMGMSRAHGLARERIRVSEATPAAPPTSKSQTTGVDGTPSTAPGRAERVKTLGSSSHKQKDLSRYVSWIFPVEASASDRIHGVGLATPVLIRFHPLECIFFVCYSDTTARFFDIALNPIAIGTSSTSLSPAAARIPAYCVQWTDNTTSGKGASRATGSRSTASRSIGGDRSKESGQTFVAAASVLSGNVCHGTGGGVSSGFGGAGRVFAGATAGGWDGSAGTLFGDWLPSPYHLDEMVQKRTELQRRFRFLRISREIGTKLSEVASRRRAAVNSAQRSASVGAHGLGSLAAMSATVLDSVMGTSDSDVISADTTTEDLRDMYQMQSCLAEAAEGNTRVLLGAATTSTYLSSLRIIDTGTPECGWAAGRGTPFSAIDPVRVLRVNAAATVLHEQVFNTPLMRGVAEHVSAAVPAIAGSVAGGGGSLVAPSSGGVGEVGGARALDHVGDGGLAGDVGVVHGHQYAYLDYVARRLRGDLLAGEVEARCVNVLASTTERMRRTRFESDKKRKSQSDGPSEDGESVFSRRKVGDGYGADDQEGAASDLLTDSKVRSHVSGDSLQDDVAGASEQRTWASLPFSLWMNACHPTHAAEETVVVAMDKGPVVVIRTHMLQRHASGSPFSPDAVLRAHLAAGQLRMAFDIVRATLSVRLFLVWVEELLGHLHVAFASRNVLTSSSEGGGSFGSGGGSQGHSVLYGGASSSAGASGSSLPRSVGGYATVGRANIVPRTVEGLLMLLVSGLEWATEAAGSAALVAFESLEERERFLEVFSTAVRLCVSFGAFREGLFMAWARGSEMDVSWAVAWVFDAFGDHASARAMVRAAYRQGSRPVRELTHRAPQSSGPGGHGFLGNNDSTMSRWRDYDGQASILGVAGGVTHGARFKVGQALGSSPLQDSVMGGAVGAGEWDTPRGDDDSRMAGVTVEMATSNTSLCGGGSDPYSALTGTSDMPTAATVAKCTSDRARGVLHACATMVVDADGSAVGRTLMYRDDAGAPVGIVASLQALRSISSRDASIAWDIRRRLSHPYSVNAVMRPLRHHQMRSLRISVTPLQVTVMKRFAQCSAILSQYLGIEDMNVCSKALALTCAGIERVKKVNGQQVSGGQRARGSRRSVKREKGDIPPESPLAWRMGETIADRTTTRALGLWMEMNGFTKAAFVLYTSNNMVDELSDLRGQINHDRSMQSRHDKRHFDVPLTLQTTMGCQ